MAIDFGNAADVVVSAIPQVRMMNESAKHVRDLQSLRSFLLFGLLIIRGVAISQARVMSRGAQLVR